MLKINLKSTKVKNVKYIFVQEKDTKIIEICELINKQSILKIAIYSSG